MNKRSNKKFYVSKLVGRLKKSDRKAFNQLFELLWENTFTHAAYMVTDEDVAKDIVQDIWLDIWNRRKTIKNHDFERYIYKAVRNNCYKHFRSAKLKPVQLEVIKTLNLKYEAAIDELHDLEEKKVLISSTLKQLPQRCQQIFRMSRYDLVPNEQIAERLGISKRSVENQLSLALKAIKSTFLAPYNISAISFLLMFFS